MSDELMDDLAYFRSHSAAYGKAYNGKGDIKAIRHFINRYKPEIVCLCGSTRFMDEFQKQNLKFTLEGKIVLSIGCDTKSDDQLKITDEQKEMLDDLHKRKIDLADYVYVINPRSYIGESTKSEIEYAIKAGKKLVFFSPASEYGAVNGSI